MKASAGVAVAPGPPELLVVGLDRGRQVDMDDVAHVRLVDAHAEGDGRDHDDAGLGDEAVEPLAPDVGIHAGVVGERLVTLARELAGRLLALGARQAVDDAALALAFGHEAGELAPSSSALGCDGKPDVGPVEAGDEDLRVAAEQARRRCRRG